MRARPSWPLQSRPLLFRFVARMLLAAVLVALAGGFAGGDHRRATDPRLAGFLAVGGSLADICADLHGLPEHPGSCCASCLPFVPGLGPRPLAAPAAARRLAGRAPGARPAQPTRARRAPSPGQPRAPPSGLR